MNRQSYQQHPSQGQYPQQGQHPPKQAQHHHQQPQVAQSLKKIDPPQPKQTPSEDESDTRGVTGKWLVETLGLVVLAFVIAMGVRMFIVEPYRIPTGSMLPTIQIDDHIMIYRLGTHLGSTPDSFDIVVFNDPTNVFPSLVKRVIATEGQVIDLTPEGRVTIDGAIINEPYIADGSLTFPLQPEANLVQPITFPFSVPAGHVFVMGDNRQRSSDSRAFGPVPVSEVKGVAFFTYWPLGHFATLE